MRQNMKKELFSLLAAGAAAMAADMPVLGDRMILDVPEGAQYGQRTTALMEAFPGDDETLIWVGEGADRIAIYAKELNVLADDDFEKQAQRFLARYDKSGDILEIKTQSPDVVYALRKTETETTGSDTDIDMFGLAVIRYKDGSMIFLQILFGENHAKTPEKNCEWVEKVIRSVRFGAGERNIADRNETVRFFGSLSIEVPVPEGFVRTEHPGYDFSYTNFTKLKRMAEPADYFGIYFGLHPSFHKERFEGAQKVTDTVAGRAVTWFLTEPEPGVYRAECCRSEPVPTPHMGRKRGLIRQLGAVLFGDDSYADPPPLYMHLIIVAHSAEARAAQIKQLSRIRKIEKPTK